MTEQEIRKEVKRNLRRTTLQNFKNKASTVGVAALCGIVSLIIVSPFFVHLFGVTETFTLSHGWTIATGILAIPAALIYAACIILLLASPIICIVNKVKEHNRYVDAEVKAYKAYYKEKGKF